MSMAKRVLEGINRQTKRKFHKLLGNVSLVKPIIDTLGFGEIVEKAMEDEPNHKKIENKKASEVLLINRLISPMPIVHVEEWVDEETCVGDIYKVEKGSMNDDRIADLLDEINPHLDDIWTNLVSNAISNYDIPTNVLFNDITSVYFEGRYDESELAKNGYSRDQKPDKKQVNLDIDSNGSGIPLVYKLLEGNTSDKSTVIDNMEDIIKMIKESNLKERPLVVGDRAMLNAKIIIAYHKRDDLDYLGAIQITNNIKDIIRNISDETYRVIDTKKDHGLYEGCFVPFQVSYDGEEVETRLLIVKSGQKELLDIKRRDKAIKTFTDTIDDLKLKINRGKYKELESVEERIESLSKRHKGSQYVNIEVIQDSSLKLEIKYMLNEDKIDAEKILDGKYVLVTNRMDMSAEQVLITYKRRDISEKDFEILKSELKVRPIFLHKDERIESLVFFSMCALLVYTILKLILLKNGLGITVRRAFKAFRFLSINYQEFIDGSILRQSADLNKTQKMIIEELCFPEPDSYLEIIV